MRLFASIFILFLCISKESLANDEAPLRIASLSPHMTEWLYQLGLGDNIVAVSAYSDYPKAALKHPVIADVNGINLTQLIKLKPDLVMLWQPNSKMGQAEKLKRLGFKLFYSNPKSLADIVKEVKQIAKLTGREAAAEKFEMDFNQKLSSLKKQYQSRPLQRTFFQIWHHPLMTTNDSSLINQAMQICALDNVFADAPMPYPTVNKEQVLAKKPDVIIISSKKNVTNEAKMWQTLKVIPAVKTNRIFTVDPDYLHRYTMRALTGIETLCQLTAQKKPML